MNARVGMVNCPFCGASDPGALCLDCGRDKAAPRRVCKACKAQTPLGEAVCHACGQRSVSDLRWKVPVIVGMFAAAFVVSVLVYAV